MFRIDRTTDILSPLFARIMEVRRRVYVNECQYPQEFISDPYDSISEHFLLAAGNADVGTVRLTLGKHGPLEIESQNSSWSTAVADCRLRGEAVCELTRLMLVPAARGGEGAVRLLFTAGQRALALGQDRLFLAGKEGALGRIYRKLGAKVYDSASRAYRINGTPLGEYTLLSLTRQDAEVTIIHLTASWPFLIGDEERDIHDG